MENPLITLPNQDIEKPTDILNYLQTSLDTLVSKYLYVAEEAIQKKMEDFVLSHNEISTRYQDIQNLSFHLELTNNIMKLVPHNLYTLVVSEGIVRPYSELCFINRYEIGDKIFVFDPVVNKAITVNLDL